MSLRRRLAAIARTLFRRKALDADLDEELRGWVDELAERRAREGHDLAAARRAALLETGGVEQVKERVRDVRWGRTLESLAKDLRYALRGLRRSPAFAVVAVVSLALGVGANTALFSVVNGVLLRPAPVKDLGRLILVWETDRQSGTTREPASDPDFIDIRARATTVKPVVALEAGEVNLTTPRAEPQRLAAVRASPELLPMFGFVPIAGRLFTEDEGRPDGAKSVVISQSLWARIFNANRSAVGTEQLRLDDVPYTVVGVVADEADFGVLQILGAAAYARGFADRGEPVRVDVWLPQQPDPRSNSRDSHGLLLVGKLRPGIGANTAQQELEGVARDLERSFPRSNRGRGVHVEALADVVFGPVRPTLLLLGGAVLLVLLVACVNVANLLLARAATRGHEIGVRSALGAGTTRLARQFLVEGLVLAALGAIAGLGLALAGLRALVALAPGDVPRLSEVAIDWRVLLATLGLSAAVGVIFGLVPALHARRVDVLGSLAGSGGTRTATGHRARRQRRVLVVAEIALAVMLLAGAALLVRSLWAIEHVDAGFRAGGLLKAEYQLPVSRYPAKMANWPNFKEFHAFTDELVRRASALPGVRSAAVAGNHPLDPGFTNSFVIVGRESEAGSYQEISVRRVTPGYFQTARLARVDGRLIDDRDTTSATPVLLVNEAARRRFFKGNSPIGAKIRFWGASREIVGVVADERLHGLAEAPPVAVYLPLAQAPSVNGACVLLLGTGNDPTVLGGPVRKVFRDIDPQLAVFGVEPLDRTVGRSLGTRRFAAVLVGLFAALAVTLAGVGIHGVLAYDVAQRTRELGIRLALGARPATLVASVLGDASRLIGFGLALGLAGAFFVTRFLRSLLFAVTPTDPTAFAGVVCLLAVAAAAACIVPAWAASRVDPVAALRSE